MSIDHILTSITNTPLMITPDKLAVIMDVLTNRQHISLDLGKLGTMAPSPAAASSTARPANQTGAVAIGVISIVGSLVNRASAGESGMVSYRNIKSQLDRHLADPKIGGILLDIDSHGGMAAGVHRMAAAIRKASQIKPVYAFVDTSAFSAAYFLASAASRVILADEGAGVGSVGVIALHRDQSGHNEKEGYTYTAIYSGARKTDYSPHQPLSEEIVNELQISVDRSRIAFAAAVAGFRSLDQAAVMATEASLFYGKDAIANNMADTIATLEETVVLLTEEIVKIGDRPNFPQKEHNNKTIKFKENSGLSPIFTGGSEMTTKERLEALISNNEDAEVSLAELGYVPAENAETKATETKAAAREEGRKEGVKAGLAQAKEILDVATIGESSLAMATSMVEKGLTQEEAIAAVQQYRANLSAGNDVSSTITPLSGDGKHPLIASCEKLAIQ